MEKSLVIRWVVPLIVNTPAAATTTQNRATSALWRSTKRVSAVIATSVFLAGGRSADACQPPAQAPRTSSGDGKHVPVTPQEQRRRGYSRGSSRSAYRGRATKVSRVP